MNDGKQWLFGGKPVVALIVAAAIIIAIPIFLFGLIRLGWEFAVPWSARRRPVVLQKIKKTAETVERFVGPQTKRG
jgi:hypothetical protein